MNKIKNVARSAMNHINRHKVGYTIVGTTLVYYYIITKPSVKEWTQFMEEKGINPLEFFNPEALEEMNS